MEYNSRLEVLFWQHVFEHQGGRGELLRTGTPDTRAVNKLAMTAGIKIV